MYQAAAGALMNIAGTILGGLAAGDRKSEAEQILSRFPAIDLGTNQQEAIKANQSSLPAAERLAGSVNAFTADQLTKQLETIMPGYSKLQQDVTGMISDEISGKLPSDVLDYIRNQAASYGVAAGTVGSQAAGYRGLRNLGLTSLQMAQQGLTSAMQWTAKADALAKGTMMDVSSMFWTPQQYFMGTASERDKLYDRTMAAWGVPTSQEYWAGALKSTGGAMMGMGGGFGGGGGGGGGGVSEPPANTGFGAGGSMYNTYGMPQY